MIQSITWTEMSDNALKNNAYQNQFSELDITNTNINEIYKLIVDLIKKYKWREGIEFNKMASIPSESQSIN